MKPSGTPKPICNLCRGPVDEVYYDVPGQEPELELSMLFRFYFHCHGEIETLEVTVHDFVFRDAYPKVVFNHQ